MYKRQGMIAIINGYDCGPEGEPQWTEAQAYIASYQEEWAESNRNITQFREYLLLAE